MFIYSHYLLITMTVEYYKYLAIKYSIIAKPNKAIKQIYMPKVSKAKANIKNEH